jgi:ferrous iron transport protein A
VLPLTYVKTGDYAKVIKVGGRPDAKKHLADLGFVDGTVMNIISSHDGDIILNIKNSRLAVTKEMSEKIMIEIVTEQEAIKASTVEQEASKANEK